jgi:hypothetical protein
LNAADERIFLDICRKSRVVVEGVELAPATAPALTAPATR